MVVLLSVISLETWRWAEVGVVATCSAGVHSEMACCPSLMRTAHSTVPAYIVLLQEVANWLQTLQVLSRPPTKPAWTWYSIAPDWLRQELDQLPSVCEVSFHSFPMPLSLLLINDVGVDYRHLHAPEKHLPPPFYTLVQEAVVACQLIRLVHP